MEPWFHSSGVERVAVNREVVGSKPTGTVREYPTGFSLTSFTTGLSLTGRSRCCVARRKFNHFLLESLGLTKRIRCILQRGTQCGVVGFGGCNGQQDVAQPLNRSFLPIQIGIRWTKLEFFGLLELVKGLQNDRKQRFNILLLAASATGLLC